MAVVTFTMKSSLHCLFQMFEIVQRTSSQKFIDRLYLAKSIVN